MKIIGTKEFVVPPQLRHGLFTVGALDNLDHNPSSTTAKGSFHGTGISLFQFPTAANFGNVQSDIRPFFVDSKRNYELPDSYTIVPAMALKPASVSVSRLLNAPILKQGNLSNTESEGKNWLKHGSQLLDKTDLESGHTIS